MFQPIDEKTVGAVLDELDIHDFNKASIRQVQAISRRLEQLSGTEFIRFEMGIPGLDPAAIGIEAEHKALDKGVASKYPDMDGIPELKSEASRFIKAFINTDVSPAGCIPTVGSMQGAFASFVLTVQLTPGKDKILFLDPGFSVQKLQLKVLGYESISFDIYSYRDDKLHDKLEEYLSRGDIAGILYSNPNNPAWICLTDKELRTIGELATKYDAVVIEDLAYLAMDFRRDAGKPFEPPYQPSVSHYTDNYIMLVSASKIFSYAGQRIAVLAMSDKLFNRQYPALRARYGVGKAGNTMIQIILYAMTSGTSHTVQYALAEMFRAASDGRFDFIREVSEYGRRTKRLKEIFLKNGFNIVYDKDLDEPIGDGFFFTIGYKGTDGAELLQRLLPYGITAIALSTTGSLQPGMRICASTVQPHHYDMLDERLAMFNRNQNH